MSSSPSSKESFEYLVNNRTDNALEKVLEQLFQSEIYLLSPFLHYKNVQALRTRGQNKYYNTLELFSLYDYQRYSNSKNNYIPLNNAMIEKLKILSIVEYSKEHKVMTYDNLKEYLSITDENELNRLLFKSFTLGIIKGRVNMKERKIMITHTKSRYSLNEEVTKSTLKELIKNIDYSNNIVDDQIEKLKAQKNDYEEEINKAKISSK